jgi:hypothetical protein
MSAVPNDPFRSNEDAFLGPCARRSIVLVGHLPVMSGLWLSQYASRETRRVATVCMLRLEHDAVQLELFRASPQRIGVRAQSTLVEALRAIAPLVDRWLIVPRSGESVRLPDGTTDVVVLTGATEVACLAAYGLVKAAAESQQEPAARGTPLPIAVEVLGATPDETEQVRRHLSRTAQAFLGLELPISGELQRVAPVESAFRGTFDAHAPTLEDLFGMIRDAERAPAPRPIASGRPRTLPEPAPLSAGDRFAPRRDRVPPRARVVPADPPAAPLSELRDPTPIPFARKASAVAPAPLPIEGEAGARETPNPMQDPLPAPSRPRAVEEASESGISAPPRASAIRGEAFTPTAVEARPVADFDARSALDREAPVRVAPRRTTGVGADGLLPPDALADLVSSLPGAASDADRLTAARPGSPRPHASRLASDEVAAASGGGVDSAPFDDAPVPTAGRPAIAPSEGPMSEGMMSEGMMAEAATPSEPIACATDAVPRAAFVSAPLPAPLAPHLGAYRVLPYRAPRGPAVELALAADGTLHLVAPLGDLASLVAMRRWAVEHAELLAAAFPELRGSVEPKMHAVAGSTVDALASEGIAAAGIALHALTLVEIGNARGWLAQSISS